MNPPTPYPNRGPRAPHARAAVAVLLTLALGAGAGLLHAQTQALAAGAPVIYPAKGQTPQQQDKDRYECYDWARSHSGVDPVQMAHGATARPAATSTPSSPSAGGMLAGALGGAAVAELTDHGAGRGAATGAIGMAVIERARIRQTTQARDQQAAQQSAQQQMLRGQQLATYGRSFGACMEARGYVVK